MVICGIYVIFTLHLSFLCCQVGRCWSWSSTGRGAVCCVQVELAVVRGGRGFHPQQRFCWFALLADQQLPLCRKRVTEEEGNSAGEVQQHILTGKVCFLSVDVFRKLLIELLCFVFFRLHIGGLCAVAWASVTNTPLFCMLWSSFPGSFTNFTHTG